MDTRVPGAHRLTEVQRRTETCQHVCKTRERRMRNAREKEKEKKENREDGSLKAGKRGGDNRRDNKRELTYNRRELTGRHGQSIVRVYTEVSEHTKHRQDLVADAQTRAQRQGAGASSQRLASTTVLSPTRRPRAAPCVPPCECRPDAPHHAGAVRAAESRPRQEPLLQPGTQARPATQPCGPCSSRPARPGRECAPHHTGPCQRRDAQGGSTRRSPSDPPWRVGGPGPRGRQPHRRVASRQAGGAARR